MDKKRPTTPTEWPAAKSMRFDAPPDLLPADTTTGTAFSPCTVTNDAFTVGWICALPIELTASVAMLDERLTNLPHILGDPNTYTLGRMGEHNVVLACLPAGTTGTNAAATAATNMMRSFPNIRFTLMVGIGGGAPGMPSDDPRNDIRLGDVVVSCPTVDSSGVLQYDFGKTMTEGKFVQTGTLNKTSIALRTGISALRARHRMEESQVSLYIATMLQSNKKMREYFDHPGLEHDQLFRADYDHREGESDCEICDRDALLARKPRSDKDPVIHYGLIGSANQIMKHGITRERLRQEKGILCFEMEAAGLMDVLPCLVVRGICDYADSHKNKRWQPYAATVAAAYAKEILYVIPAAEVAAKSITNSTDIHEMFRSTIDESNLKQLLQFLPVAGQSQQTSSIPNLNPDDPKFSWVFRNMDYRSWRSKDGPLVLCLSSSLAHHLSQVSSYIVDQEKKTNCPVLYFFCSHVELATSQYADQNIALASALIYTLLGQIVHLSPMDKRILILRNFLNGLLQKRFESETIQNWIEHDFDKEELLKSLQNLLGNMTLEDLLTMFRTALDYAKPRPSLVVLDGIEKAYQGGRLLRLIEILINDLRRQNSNVKVLLVGPTPCHITGLSQESLYIEHDTERRECLSSLKFENTRYEKISPEHRGSLEWIWTHDEYKKWFASETSRLLYIQGKPGSGKSTLTKYFDSNLHTREPAAKQAVVAKFFYSFREGELQRSHYNMVLSLLYDILYQEEAFFYHHFQNEYRTHRRSGMKWDYKSLKRVLSSLQDYSTLKRFYLIIDAVDESEEVDRRDILILLHELCSKAKNCAIKIFIASRPVAQLEARRDQFLNFIRLHDETISDISNFTHSLLDGLDLTQVIAYILDNAQGVFLWVKLVGEELLRLHDDGYSEHDIFDLLKQLPTELGELYALMLNKMRANKSWLSYGLKMFRFVLFAKRPLRVNELLHSLGIPDNIESNSVFSLSDESFEKRIPSSERIIISCGGNFLEIRQRQDGQRIVQAIHQTAVEFLRDPHGVVANSEFRIDEEYAHIFIAITCIRYILVCAKNTSRLAGLPYSEHWISDHHKYYAKYLDKRPLASYACCYLKDHIDDCWKYVNQNSSIQHLAAQLTGDWVRDPFNFLLVSWAGSHLEPGNSTIIKSKILFDAAMGGFAVAAETLISVGMDIIMEDESGRTPLSWATGNGRVATTNLLLAQGADIKAKDKSGRTPLSWATGNGQEAITNLLLAKGADIETKDVSNRTPLSWAAGNGRVAIINLLLAKGANIEAMDLFGRTPLSWAAENGQEATINLLLILGANIKAMDLFGRTPLSWAAENGQEATINLLLAKGANIEAMDLSGRTPLSWAAENRQEATINLLLAKGANIEAMDLSGRTPLSWAAKNRHQAIVELLLQYRTDIQVREKLEIETSLSAISPAIS